MSVPDRKALNRALDNALELANEGWTYVMDYYHDKWGFAQRYEAVADVLQASKLAQLALEEPPAAWEASYEAKQLKEALLELIEWPQNTSQPSNELLVQALLAWKADMDPSSVLDDAP